MEGDENLSQLEVSQLHNTEAAGAVCVSFWEVKTLAQWNVMLTFEAYSTPKATFRTTEYRNWCFVMVDLYFVDGTRRTFPDVLNIIFMSLFIYGLFNKFVGLSNTIDLAWLTD